MLGRAPGIDRVFERQGAQVTHGGAEYTLKQHMDAEPITKKSVSTLDVSCQRTAVGA